MTWSHFTSKILSMMWSHFYSYFLPNYSVLNEISVYISTIYIRYNPTVVMLQGMGKTYKVLLMSWGQ